MRVSAAAMAMVASPNSNFEPRHKNNFTCYLNQLTIPTAVSPNFSVSFFQKL
jgi:hypothetical protein